MTWQIVVLILGVLAFFFGESYMNVLKQRNEIARYLANLGPSADFPEISDVEATRLGNGDS